MKKIRFVFIIALGVFLFSAYQIYQILSEYHEGDVSYDSLKDQYRSVVVREDSSSPEISRTDEARQQAQQDPAQQDPTEQDPTQQDPSAAASVPVRHFPDYSEHEHEAELTLMLIPFDYVLVPEYVFDFDQLLRLNPDVKGWILIDGTHIDYPIVQAADNDYYLRKTVDLTPNNAGSIFIDYRNQEPFLQNNTIIYGHNQKSGHMFHDLIRYQEEDFFKKHSYIHIYTADGKHYLYEIYSMYITSENSMTYQLNFYDNDFFSGYVNYTKENSILSSSLPVGPNDRILTLSTCTNAADTERVVVHARFVTSIIGS